MKGRFLRARIRCASRAGRSDKMKFAEEKSASADSGGRPCLSSSCWLVMWPGLELQQYNSRHRQSKFSYLTRSASVSGYNGLDESEAIRSSLILIGGGNGGGGCWGESRWGSSLLFLLMLVRVTYCLDVRYGGCRVREKSDGTTRSSCVVGRSEM